MLPSPYAAPPDGEGWVHEAKLDGYRCMAQVHRSRFATLVQGRRRVVGRVPELDGLAVVGDVGLDDEVAVITASERSAPQPRPLRLRRGLKTQRECIARSKNV
jgi:ATP-dependent DNA ligase